ncbi:MAG: UvrD-helicase domain-containing protein [Desulfobacterales bacterium]|jgi:uncharacterized protein (TIGR00375 family)
MKFIADLHVHSKFSRATAKNLDLENLYMAAQLKGVTVVGTGDFTFPAWFAELREKLEPAEPGLYKLKKEVAKFCDAAVPEICRRQVRFILATEISNIYKKNGKTRKNHNLVLVPDLDTAERFNAKLDRIGNIKSDGRPILGLDARDLLEILLETSHKSFLIPAHIWTPWFSILGSKSGFDSIEECFEDLTSQIFAVETGLSSDPPMNWRISDLDNLTLVSNSDAHSPSNLGREANLFNTQLSYSGLKLALQTGDPETFLGTFEFYPEEGKYHLDGHRKCKMRLWPEKTMNYNGKCPVCGKPLTIGVLYRVEELADRHKGEKPQKHHCYYSIIQLVDILSQILKVGVNSKKVKTAYHNALVKLGSEFDILHTLKPDAIERAGIPLLGEAIRRMRKKEIDVLPGYDGEYGRIKIFKPDEHEQLLGQKPLFSLPKAHSRAKNELAPVESMPPTPALKALKMQNKFSAAARSGGVSFSEFHQLNAEQLKAVKYPGGPLLIVAGPGTGKTRTLTHRIAFLVKEKGVLPQHILAVTFTNKAAQEMRERLNHLIKESPSLPLVTTFHSLCFKILRDQKVKPTGIIDEAHRKALITEAIRHVHATGNQVSLKPQEILSRIIVAKQQILTPAEFEVAYTNDVDSRTVSNIYRTYQRLLSIQGLCDFEDLIFNVVRLFETHANHRRKYQDKFQHIFVDEYQDLNQAQYRILRALAPNSNSVKDLCVIGDPDQSIYGFRGSDVAYFRRFIRDYPGAGMITLSRNYRSARSILNASFQVINNHRIQKSSGRTYSQIDGVKTVSILELVNERVEAETIARLIEQLIGGSGFHSIDMGTVKDANLIKSNSYADFAILYRTNDQHRVIAQVFEACGIPFQIVSRDHALNQKGLPETISFFKIIEGNGGFLDYEKAIQFTVPGIGKKAGEQFKAWCYQNCFSLQEGLSKAVRFPISGLASSKQQQLNAFFKKLLQYKSEMNSMSVADKLLFLKKNTKLSDILKTDTQVQDAFSRLVEFARQFDTHTTDFFTATDLHADTDTYVPRVEKVSLMTMHAAKGLEFPIVFIAGCEENLIPYRRSDHEQADIEEERRLFYVAMTRAMERLYLTRAKKRRIYGKTHDRELSSFVTDIEQKLKKDETPLFKKRKTENHQVQLKLF